MSDLHNKPCVPDADYFTLAGYLIGCILQTQNSDRLIQKPLMITKLMKVETSGLTSIPFWCATLTASDPGSAMPGQPASDIIQHPHPLVLLKEIQPCHHDACACLFH